MLSRRLFVCSLCSSSNSNAMRSTDIFHTIVVVFYTTPITFPLFITYVICLTSPVETPFNEHGVYNNSTTSASVLRYTISHISHVQLVGLNARVHVYLMGFAVLFSSQKKFELVWGARILFATTIQSMTAIGFIVHCRRCNHRESHLCQVRFSYVIALAIFFDFYGFQSRKIGFLNKMRFVANGK